MCAENENLISYNELVNLYEISEEELSLVKDINFKYLCEQFVNVQRRHSAFKSGIYALIGEGKGFEVGSTDIDG